MNVSRWQLAGIIVATAIVTSAAPVAARTVVNFARNSGHVNGIKAVGAIASVSDRADKLVATKDDGYLPNDIIRKAQAAKEADKLQGHSAAAFVTECGEAAILGKAVVPADVGSNYTTVPGFQTQVGGAVSADTGIACRIDPAEARHVQTGVYRVRVATIIGGCGSSTLPAEDAAATVTVRSDSGEPLIATYAPVCDPGQSNRVVDEVHISDLNGNPADATFALSLINYGGFPIPVGHSHH